MVDLSVIIPTYNGAKRLPLVLQHLKVQQGVECLSWEILVVDNNSKDETAQVVSSAQAEWLAGVPLQYCFEPKQGAAYARHRGVREAQGKLIGFLDDDNWPADNWVKAAYEFGLSHLGAGAWGSRIQGKFAGEPPPEISQIACMIGIIDRGTEPSRYLPQQKILPPGAGLVVRREAWIQQVPPELVLNHTGKAAGLASEDLEAVFYIQKGGWEVWYNPQMEVSHAISPERLELDYLLGVYRCIGLSRYHLRVLRWQWWQIPAMTLLCLGYDLYQLIKHRSRHRETESSSLLYACESQLLYSSFISPFFLLKTRYLHLWQGWLLEMIAQVLPNSKNNINHSPHP